MKSISILLLGFLILSCGKKSSGSDPVPPPETAGPVTGESTAVVAPPEKAAENPASSENPAPAEIPTSTENPAATAEPAPLLEKQSPLALTGGFLEFSRLQYDCGDVKAPISDVSVAAVLPIDFDRLAATIPKKDQALLTLGLKEAGVSCSYRALLSVNAKFTEVTFSESQAIDAADLPACAATQKAIDASLLVKANPFDYDKTFIRWVALHIPQGLISGAICPGGTLRAVFAAQLPN